MLRIRDRKLSVVIRLAFAAESDQVAVERGALLYDALYAQLAAEPDHSPGGE